jgi:hypothetical protein
VTTVFASAEPEPGQYGDQTFLSVALIYSQPTKMPAICVVPATDCAMLPSDWVVTGSPE